MASSVLAIPALKPETHVRLDGRLERTLAFVEKPIPTGPNLKEQYEVWSQTYGGQTPSQIAAKWADEFAGLAGDLECSVSNLKGWPGTTANPADDLESFAAEILNRAFRVSEANWLWCSVKIGQDVPLADRNNASKALIEDGGWIRDQLEHILCRTQPAFNQFKDAVRRVVQWMIGAPTAELNTPAAKGTTSAGRGRGKNINAGMLQTLSINPDALHWTARQWGGHLDCRESTVAGTKTWKETIKAARALESAGKMRRPNQAGRRVTKGAR